ncbi:N-acetyltransferase [Patescibacteria group bacterium]|nr:N-acetyltransferase [Patescibacteria group bacterium]MBU1931400.1 N-acetyltransferase [Patescibacteria group bacterium]
MISKNVHLGKNVKIYQPELVNLYSCEIGDNTKIAAFVEIQKGVKVGQNCKIQAFAFIPEGVTIGDEVFIGPHVCFINDKYPKAVNSDGSLKQAGDWQITPTVVEKGAAIGAGAVILCGVTIGKNSLIGAGAVVTKNVAPGQTVIANPAQVLK